MRRRIQRWQRRIMGLRIVRLGLPLVNRIGRDDVGAYAEAITYTALLSLMPLLLFVSTLLAEFHLPTVIHTLEGPLGTVLPDLARSTVIGFLRGVAGHQSRTLLSVSLLGYLYGMSGAFRQVTDALNHVHEFPQPLTRPLWKTYVLSIILSVTVGLAFVLATVLLTPASDFIQRLVRLWTGHVFAANLIDMGRWFLALGFAYVSVVVVYAVAPDRPQPLRWISPGAVLAVLGFLILTVAMSIYAAHFSGMNRIYGALGGLVFLLLYMDFTALVFLVGAEVNLSGFGSGPPVAVRASLPGTPVPQRPGAPTYGDGDGDGDGGGGRSSIQPVITDPYRAGPPSEPRP